MGVEDDFDLEAAGKLMSDIESFLIKGEKYTESERAEASWRIPVGDTEVSDLTKQPERASQHSSMRKGYELMHKTIGSKATVEEIQSHRAAHASYFTQMTRMYDCLPILSNTGFVGLAPMQAKTGDSVVIFKGAGVPYVIRKDPADDLWTLIGEAHVHGIMDGQFMETVPHVHHFTIC